MNRELSSLRSFFRYLHRTGRIDKEVMYRIHALKTSRRIPAFVPSTRMEGILDELDRESESPEFKFVRNSLIVLLFYSCGLRLAELVGIDRDDFSGDYTALKVRGKGDKERIVPILPPVREKILHYLDEIDRQGICISKEKALFLNQQGKRISRSTVYRTVQSQLRQGGVQGKKSPHVLRHTFATEWDTLRYRPRRSIRTTASPSCRRSIPKLTRARKTERSKQNNRIDRPEHSSADNEPYKT